MKIYIAAPGFNPEQLGAISEVEQILEELNIQNFSPFRDGITLSPDATREEKSKVFKENVNSVNSCDVMIAIIDDRDTGTTFEIGVFYSNWLRQKYAAGFRIVQGHRETHPSDEAIYDQTHPRLIMYLTKPKSNISVMLTEASLRLCIGKEDLKSYLENLKKEGHINAVRDDNSFDSVLTH